jgi:hypothetical protein
MLVVHQLLLMAQDGRVQVVVVQVLLVKLLQAHQFVAQAVQDYYLQEQQQLY